MRLKIYNIVYIGIFSTLFFILGTMSISAYNIKLTFQNLPLYVGAIILGPVNGMLIGGIGSFLVQLMFYSIMPTTIIWVLPHMIIGLITGLVFTKKIVDIDEIPKCWIVIILLNILLTILNTISLYLDSLINGYFSPLIISALFFRILLSIIIGIIYCFIVPFIVKVVKKYK